MTQSPPPWQPGHGGPSTYGPPPPGYGHPTFPPPPPPVAPDGQPPASFGDRLLAYLIDWVILCAVGLVLMVPAVLYMFGLLSDWSADLAARYPDPNRPPPPSEIFSVFLVLIPLQVAIVVLMLAVLYVYRVEMMFRSGQTVGKRVMKLRVVPRDPAAGGRLTRAVAVRRWLVDSLGAQLVPFLHLLDGLWQLWDQPYRQCLHDKVADTVVVKVMAWR